MSIEQAVKLSTLLCATCTQLGSSHYGTNAPPRLPLYWVPPSRHSRLAGRQPWKTASGSTATTPSAPLPKRKAVSVEKPPQGRHFHLAGVIWLINVGEAATEEPAATVVGRRDKAAAAEGGGVVWECGCYNWVIIQQLSLYIYCFLLSLSIYQKQALWNQLL